MPHIPPNSPGVAYHLALQDLDAVRILIERIKNHSINDADFKQHIHLIVEEIQNLCSSIGEEKSAELRQLIAQLGDAYEFYRLTGDASQLHEFLQTIQQSCQ